jgi:hypothetical protein
MITRSLTLGHPVSRRWKLSKNRYIEAARNDCGVSGAIGDEMHPGAE